MSDNDKPKNRVINTAKQADENPGFAIGMAALLGASGAIEHSERQGQKQLVESDVIPAKSNWETDADAILTKWGFQLGDPVEGDEIFRYAKLPPGWKKVGSDHDMWSHIVDEKGRKRISIFYKAAFYDRSAHFNIERRYTTTTEHQDKKMRHVAKDGETVIFALDWYEQEKDAPNYDRYRDDSNKVRAWLVEHYPNHGDNTAYWDE